MVAEPKILIFCVSLGCSLAKISMVAELTHDSYMRRDSCSLAKISMVAEPSRETATDNLCCSLAKISMVAERKL